MNLPDFCINSMADTFYQYLSVVARDFIFFSGDVQTTTIAVAIASSLCCSIVWAICHVVNVAQNSNGSNKRRSLTSSSWNFTSTHLDKSATKFSTKTHQDSLCSDDALDDLYNQQVEVPCVRCSDYFADPSCRFVTCKLCCFSKSACFFHQNNKHVRRRRYKHPSNIRQLDLSKCQINQCPDRIGYVGAQLTHLNLSSNKLVELPSEIGCLRGLQELSVSDNSIEELPESLGTLCNLKILKLAHNKIQILPEFLSFLTCLELLDISHNSLLLLPANIGELRGLQFLYAGGNKLEEIPSGLYSLLSLKVLDIKANHLQSLQNNIKQLLRLEVLDVTDCDLDTFPKGLVYCSSLVSLHAAFNRINELPVFIGLMSHLEDLDIQHNQLKYLPANLDINRLRTLTVSENPFLTSNSCDKCTIDSLTIKHATKELPSLLELCARCIAYNESRLSDRSCLPQSLNDMLQKRRSCTRCGGPFFTFYESKIEFTQYHQMTIPFYTETCTPYNSCCF